MMKDLNEILLLLEKIDPQYKKYMSIKKEISEAKRDDFSYEELTQICDNFFKNSSSSISGDKNEEAIRYCNEKLGPIIGAGSSRYVYQIEDEECLKLAVNIKGLAQNKVESETIKEINSPLFPFIFDIAPNYTWILAECVLPSTADDFRHCLGIEPGSFFNIIFKIKELKRKGGMDAYQEEIADKYGDCELYRNLAKYILDFDIPVGDLARLENWGLTKRNGKEALVILDAGFNKEVWVNHYGGKYFVST